MPSLMRTVAVDEQLTWVVRVPTLRVGAARPPSPEQLARFAAPFESWRDDDAAERRQVLVDTVALTVLETLCEPPELPFIGEPFGGQDGTD